MHVFLVVFALLLAARLVIYFFSNESAAKAPVEPVKWVGNSGKTYASYSDKFNNND